MANQTKTLHAYFNQPVRKSAPLIGLRDENIDKDTAITIEIYATEILWKKRPRKKPWAIRGALEVCNKMRFEKEAVWSRMSEKILVKQAGNHDWCFNKICSKSWSRNWLQGLSHGWLNIYSLKRAIYSSATNSILSPPPFTRAWSGCKSSWKVLNPKPQR